MTAWETYLQQNQSRFVDELLDFLRIPSISSLPEHAEDVREAARWVIGRMERAGLENRQILPTGGHPVVYGDWLHADGRPTILIYGHFDTQPVDPLALWSNPPFEPVIRQGRIYARGASDDKGNMLIPILAVEAWLQSQGPLPVNVKLFFEGQEEIGSPQLPDLVAAQKELLACDTVLSADGGQWAEDQGALTIGRRGICALQVDVTGPAQDLHSGTYGGTLMNPIMALARILASLHSPDGKILVEGFYDDVRELTEIEKLQIREIPFDEAGYTRDLGIASLFGEPGYSTYERAWVRPTLEINGIWGGFQGSGIKTVLPSQAHAKITCRLVPDQQPEKVVSAVIHHIKKHAPTAVTVHAHPIPGSANPFLIPYDHPTNQAVARVLERLYGKKPYITRMGGTIPVGDLFLKHLGAHMAGLSFGLKDENIHAPDEFFRLTSFERGQRAYCLVLEELGAMQPPT